MFSSNQKFKISGDNGNENQLFMAVQLLIKGYEFRAKEYEIRNDGKFVIYKYESVCRDKTSAHGIDAADSMNITYIQKLIEMWLASNAYQASLRNVQKEGGDGSHYPGWVMKADNESVVIAPYWAFYHK